MEYNECKICGAKDGRAGNLIASEKYNKVSMCYNCFDTLETGSLVIHANLKRTDEEMEKTANLLNNNRFDNNFIYEI